MGPQAGLRVERGASPQGAQPAPIPTRPIRIRRDRWMAFVDVFERRTMADLVWLWLGTIVTCAVLYWLLARSGIGALRHEDAEISREARGLLASLYYSFGVATSAALGDIVPRGPLRVITIIEAVAGVVLFGALVTKLLSRRQEEVMTAIHRIAFEDRLERVQTDLHMVLIELQSIAQLCRLPDMPEEQIRVRVDSASGICLAEIRAIHGLLYRPQDSPAEGMMEGILASLASVLRELRDLVQCLSSRSPYLTRNLAALTQLADEICADCVPHVYAHNLREWMDVIHSVGSEMR